MTNFIQDFMSDIGPQAVAHSANILGVDYEKISAVLPLVASLLLCGLKRQKDDHGGMDRIDHILNRYGEDHILEDLPSFFADRAIDHHVNSSLGGILGQSGLTAEKMLAVKFDLDRITTGRMITMVAPVILGYLSRNRRQSGIGLSGISAILDREADSALLDDLSSAFVRDRRHAANTTVLAELLKGLTSANR